MKLKKQIGSFFSCLLFVFYGCSNEPQIRTEEKTKADSAVTSQKDTTHEDLESKLMNAVMNLPEVQKINSYIDSISDHQKGVAGILDEPEGNETDYCVRVGYNGEERFEVYNFFYVDPKTFAIKIQDIDTDSILPIEEWRKMKNR